MLRRRPRLAGRLPHSVSAKEKRQPEDRRFDRNKTQKAPR
ncbi:hypothetical protein P3T17_004398 [Paraburkholderia sp. GAS82]